MATSASRYDTRPTDRTSPPTRTRVTRSAGARQSAGVTLFKAGVKLVTNYHRQRQNVVRHYLFPLAPRFTPSIAVEHNDTWYFVSTCDSVGRAMFVRSYHEEHRQMAHSIGIAQQLLGFSPLRGRTFVDIGGHIGTSTIPALKDFEAADALVFEPEPLNLRPILTCRLRMGLTTE